MGCPPITSTRISILSMSPPFSFRPSNALLARADAVIATELSISAAKPRGIPCHHPPAYRKQNPIQTKEILVCVENLLSNLDDCLLSNYRKHPRSGKNVVTIYETGGNLNLWTGTVLGFSNGTKHA